MTATANIPLGAAATRTVQVTRELTVAHFHPHMPEVYGTPMMIYLMEVAATDAIAAYLPEGWVSVGLKVDITHLAATPAGFTVTATARVVAVGDDNTVTFAVEAHDGMERIGTGTHVRAAVATERFARRFQAKQAGVPTQR